MVADGRMWFGKDGNGVPRVKTYLHAKERGLVPETILFATDVGTNESAKNDLKKLFGGVAAFDTPKPVALLQTLIRIGSRPDSTVLDFFAGSGTMGEAVLRLNAEDNGTRRVVQVQLPEILPSDSEARRLGHDTVADIARDRWSRVAEKLGPSADTSLRCLALERSSFRHPSDADPTQLDLSDTTLAVEPDAHNSIAAEILLKEGVPLDAAWERSEAGGAPVIIADGVAVVLCPDVTDEVVRQALAAEPRVVVFLEDGLAGADAVKANAVTNARNLGITLKTV
jgi:adenine-specific DNA-methyltransferase